MGRSSLPLHEYSRPVQHVSTVARPIWLKQHQTQWLAQAGSEDKDRPVYRQISREQLRFSCGLR